MEGYLKKWVNVVSGWKSRYFVLHDGILTYCDKKGEPIKGNISLKVANVISIPEDPLRIVLETGTSEIHIRTSTMAEKIKWFSALKDAQEKALKEDEYKSYPEQEIQLYEGRLSVGTKAILNESNLEKLKDDLAELWVKQSQFDETLSLLAPKAQKIPGMNELASKLEELGKEIKYQVTECVQKIEQEKKKMVVIMHKYESFAGSQLGSQLGSPLPTRYNAISNYEQSGNGYPDAYDPNDETEFESFYEEEEKEPANSEFFHNPDQEKVSTITMKKKNQPNVINLTDDDRDERNKSPLLLPSFKDSGILGSPSLDHLDQIVAKIVNTNPAFKIGGIPTEKIRKVMPHLIDPHEKLNIWGILKELIGKDLTRFAVPVFLNEPLSMLQRLCEQLEYSELLDKADQCSDSCLRLAYCAAFGASAFYSSIPRLKKPFNPVLGETFEYIPVDGSFRFVSEQVSHHPPISAGYGENSHFEWFGDTDVKTSFWGKSMEMKAPGTSHIILKKYGDHITYKRPTISIQNIIIGTMYIDYFGDMPYTNHKTGDTANLEFKQRSWTGKGAYEMEGWVKDKNGKIRYKLIGRWDSNLKAINEDTKEEIMLWTPHPKGDKFEEQYAFMEFTKQLNYLHAELLPYLPPTDSRLRPDQRALEFGQRELAADEKHRIEEKQRARRKEMKEANQVHVPRWFEEVTDQTTGEKIYKYKGGYFEYRQARNFSDSLDIFS